MTSAADFDKKYGIIDEKTPPNSLMTGLYKKSFAHYTLRERLPVILTQILDNLSKDKDELADKYGESTRDEIKDLVGNISKLKYQLQTDKELEPFTGNEPDKILWNNFILTLTPENCTFFKTCWLYAECYMYRKVRSFFEAVTLLNGYDYFAKQKENALTCCTDALEAIVKSTRNNNQADGELFRKLLKLNLWGNRCDLSISEGKEIKQTGNQFDMIDKLEENVLVDDSQLIWKCLSEDYNGERVIDIVMDNSGFEFFTDMIVAEYIIDKKLASKVRFHAKALPWYISDVTPRDFHWSLNYLSNHQSQVLCEVGKKWSELLKNNQFELCPLEYFWTTPYEFHRMEEIDENLYKKLGESHLTVFKGDLNYRKLLGDFTWDSTENFKTCLRGFLPSNICALRTVKADLICGLAPGVAKKLDESSTNWMFTGEYGILQFANKQ